MSAVLATKGMGGRLVASYGVGSGTSSSPTSGPDQFNIVAQFLFDSDRKTTITSQYANLSRKTP